MSGNELLNETLAGALDLEYRTADLKNLADLICFQVPTRKPERIEAIVSTMFGDLKNIFGQLPSIAQKAVSEAVHTWDGFYNSQMFESKYLASPWSQTEGRTWSNSGLIYLFLIRGQIPKDLLEKLRDVAPLPQEDQINYHVAKGADDDDISSENISHQDSFPKEYTVRYTSDAALINLDTILHLVADDKIRVSAKTGCASAATVTKIDGLLCGGDWYEEGETDSMQAFAWPLLLQGGGLAKADGTLLKLTPAGRKALKNELANGIKRAWEKWEKSKLFDEFSRVRDIKGQKSSRGRTMTNPTRRRPMINALLADLQPGKWIDVDELGRTMQTKSKYLFEMVNYNWKLYFCDQHYGYFDCDSSWMILQFRYLLVYLFEYCATLGLVDVVYKDPFGSRSDLDPYWGTDEIPFLTHCDGLQYIRVNALGAFVFGHTSEFEVKKDTHKSYLYEGLDILFAGKGAISPGEGLYLEKIAERTEVDRWRLSVSSLFAAIKQGESLVEIRQFFARSSDAELSPEIEQLFKDVEQRTTAFVEIGQTSLIECSLEFRKQVLSHRKLSSLCLPAGEKHLVLLPGKEKKFASALEAIGFIVGLKK